MEESIRVAVCEAKYDYECHLVASSNDKGKLFRHLKYLISSESIPCCLFYNDTCATDPLHKYELFNNFFNSVFVHSCSPFSTLDMLPRTPKDSDLSSITVTEEEVWEVISTLNPNKAIGPDNIGPAILKACATPLTSPLCQLFNLCLSTATIPEEWKQHLVTPVYKSGEKSQVSNYRPISLLCTTSKVFESLVYMKVIDHIRPQISLKQFGFLSNRSTVHKLLTTLSDIVHSIDNKCNTDVIYLDLKKAFDSVCHGELLFKLQSFGITGCLWEWFKSYLANRVHCVKLNYHTSSNLPVISGVPQGSVLGPLLFLVYINDLDSYVSSSSLSLFADDSQCLRIIHDCSDCYQLQDDLDSMAIWSTSWKTCFNALKCVHVRFGGTSNISLPPGLSYSINGSTIPSSNSHKDLGVIFTDTLSWSSHVLHVTSKAYKVLGLLKRALSSNGPDMKRTLYLTLVRSHLIYCSPVWRPYLVKDCSSREVTT